MPQAFQDYSRTSSRISQAERLVFVADLALKYRLPATGLTAEIGCGSLRTGRHCRLLRTDSYVNQSWRVVWNKF